MIFPTLALSALGFSRIIRESGWILYASELLQRQFVPVGILYCLSALSNIPGMIQEFDDFPVKKMV
mgnify:CR=1 FL=1